MMPNSACYANDSEVRDGVEPAIIPPVDLWLAMPGAAAHFNPDAQTPEDHQRWQALKSDARRRDWAVSRALLTHVQHSSPVSAHDVRSLSHSQGHAALAVARGAQNVGVDLEVASERDYLRLAEFAFHTDEHADMRALPPDALAERFYLLWTLKEAFAKALELPLLESSRECVFMYRNGDWNARVPTTQPWIARAFRPRVNLFVSIAVLGFSDNEVCVTHSEWPATSDTKNSWPTSVTLSSKSIASRVRVP
jgi:4'-phosphopantetheinyl transferase